VKGFPERRGSCGGRLRVTGKRGREQSLSTELDREDLVRPSLIKALTSTKEKNGGRLKNRLQRKKEKRRSAPLPLGATP